MESNERQTRGDAIWEELQRKVSQAPHDAARCIDELKNAIRTEMTKLDASLAEIEPAMRARIEYVAYRDLLSLLGRLTVLAAGTAIQPMLDKAKRDQDASLVREAKRRLHALVY